VRLGVINLTCSAKDAIETAKACEAAGFWGLGMGDTVPALYQDTYVTTAACFAATKTLKMGPTVTNTVTRHWSVLGATARTFEELYPGRFFAGVATGDGACHSVKLHPAKWSKVEEDVASFLTFSPNTPVQIAASGPRGCEAAGRVASDLILGAGMDVNALRALSGRARAARKAAGITTPLRIWAFANTYVAPTKAAAEAERFAARGRTMANTRFAFASTYEDKGLPEKWEGILKERLARYNFAFHGVGGPENVNGRLLDDHPDLMEYLVDRFMLVGTADQCAARLKSVAEEAGLDGAWFALPAIEPDEDVAKRVRTTGEAFQSLATAD
jgi:alkanesulfonate monooxygenase SsuD/methylene tetrahydromethanopterin reductase-like flavin-dependent oxidoreductase (luciferase family)